MQVRFSLGFHGLGAGDLLDLKAHIHQPAVALDLQHNRDPQS